MEPIVIHGDSATLYKGADGVIAKVLVDAESCGAENLAFGHISFAPGSKVPPHTRDVEEFIYVLEGTATILACGTKYILGPGDAIYMPAGTEHQHVNEDSDTTLRQIYIFAPPGPEKGVKAWPAATDDDLL